MTEKTLQKLIHKTRAKGMQGEADKAQAELDRLAKLEDGVILREDWMPEWATKWCLGTRTCYWSDGEGNHEPAPNMRPHMLRPERVSDSPLTLPIISLDEDVE